MRKTFCVLSIFLYSVAAFAQSAESVRPSVSVVGEAEMKIAPNQVQFVFEIVTTDKELAVAKLANDRAAEQTLKAAKAFNIRPDDIQTDSLTISPRHSIERTGTPRILLGYEVTKRVLITLKELDRIDGFLSKVIEAGVNRVVGVTIENSELTKYQEQVRTLAVKNARDRAATYAKQLGQNVGRAYVIREEDGDFPGYTQGRGYGSGDGMGDGSSDSAELSTPTAFNRAITFALGKISVEEKIYVTFELTKK